MGRDDGGVGREGIAGGVFLTVAPVMGGGVLLETADEIEDCPGCLEAVVIGGGVFLVGVAVIAGGVCLAGVETEGLFADASTDA